ncbi:uncharacterized protein LOC110689289 [Chenopodium quinoa]|uniref:uncharacterized protein LOC110689289 n=1 Tax=Chenopodium quinoa TaxID=63459 RepID=UPI000B775FED|nr:uncharacterized protein LOC110689289 [Chenopodium quinoa]
MYLDIGWSDFMDDNSLNVGDVLMFKYISNNSFAVKIIYRTGPPQSVGAGQTYGFGNTGKKRGRKPAIEGCSEKMMEANAWLDALADVCGEYFFKFSFTKKYFDQAIINIPLPFAKEHFMGFPPTTVVVLQNFDKQFDVELKIVMKKNKIIQCSLKNGVREFIEYYNVQVDEVGLFKYREGHPIVFDVDLVLV